MPFERQAYDHVISALSLHHILRDTKRELYAKIHAALRPGGKYIEGDSVVPADMESQFLDEYYEEAATVPPAPEGHYHIDIPFSIATQRSLLLEAGFKDFELVWQKDSTAVWNIAVYVVTKRATMNQSSRPTPAGADSAYRRSLYRGFWVLMVDLSRVVVSPTRRCGSAFPLGCDTKSCQ